MFRSQINPPRSFQKLSSSDLATSHSSLATALLTPFPATLTSHLQPVKNTTTLSPAFATLTRRVKPNSFVCHSYKKHPASNLSSQRSFRSSFPPPNFLPTRHSPLATKSFGIRTYEKLARNPFRIRTSKAQHLKPFGMNTYKKTPRGEDSPETVRITTKLSIDRLLTPAMMHSLNTLPIIRMICATK